MNREVHVRFCEGVGLKCPALLTYLHGYDDLRQARSGIERYLGYYNHRRSHQSLNGLTPEQVYHPPTADLLVPAIVHRSAQFSAPLSS